MDIHFDLECAPDLTPGALQRYIDTVEPPGNYSKPDTIAKWKMEKGEMIGRENWSKTALDPMIGSIYVFGYSIAGAEPVALYRKPEESEAKLLTDGLTAIATELDKVGQQRPPRFIGWNILAFDLPYLAKRCVINRVNVPFALPLTSRYNNEHVLDLMLAWAGYRGYEKQANVARVMGIELASDVDGKDLWATVEREGVESAAVKCRSDIQALIEIHQRMTSVFRL